VLAAAEGLSDYEIAVKLQRNRKTVMLWRRRFVQEGVGALREVAAGRGRKPTYGPEWIQAIVDTSARSRKGRLTEVAARWRQRRVSVSPP
jgi:transposase